MMKHRLAFIVLLFTITGFTVTAQMQTTWVRINLLGYKPGSPKVAVWCSKEKNAITSFSIIDVAS
jgi:hypothetical protein